MTKALVSESRLDRVIAALAPGWALKRRAARVAMAATGGFVGARRDRRATQNWAPDDSSANSALMPDLPMLRARSRDLRRNEPIAGGAISTNITNVVGGGLDVLPQIDREVLRLSDAQADRIERQISAEFAVWSETAECDLARTLPFKPQQRLVYGSSLENGDAFTWLTHRPRPGSPYGLKLQLIEADRVSNPNRRHDTPTLIQGIEYEPDTAAPVAAWISSRHPGDHYLGAAALTWQRVEIFGARSGRRNLLHHFEPDRIGQGRGIPYLAAVIEPLKQLGRYSDAELMAAVVNACFTIMTKVEAGSGTARSPLAATSSETPEASDLARVAVDFEPGMVIEGFRPNETLEGFQPGRPNAQFDPFVLAILRQIGMRLEIPYEVLIKHFTASYSAARAALLEAWRFFRTRRDWLVWTFCQPVYEAWLTEAVAIGRVRAPGFFADPLVRRAWCGAMWTGPAPGQIDPEKEGRANEIAKTHGWKTDVQITAETTGGDYEKNIRQRGREERLRIDAGLGPTPARASAPAPERLPAPNPDKKDEEDE